MTAENGKSIKDGIQRVLEEIQYIAQTLDDESFERGFNRVKFLRESSKESTYDNFQFIFNLVDLV